MRLQSKLDRNVRQQQYEDANLLNTRKMNRSKLSSKYDRKIAKATIKNKTDKVNKLTEKKDAVLKDFDAGTKAIKKAQKIGNENRNKITELKIKAISDPSIKKSASYKQAKKWAASQMVSDAYYGKSYTLLMETHYAAVNNGKSWTRGKTK